MEVVPEPAVGLRSSSAARSTFAIRLASMAVSTSGLLTVFGGRGPLVTATPTPAPSPSPSPSPSPTPPPTNPYFGPPAHTASGSMQPVASFAEDLDGFSGDDLVVADPANNSLDVMFHYDFGRFDDGARYAVAPNPTAVSGGLFRRGVARPDVA